jgi:hypothetical protein
MLSFVQQLPALIGVVIGALASYLVSNATERRRWQRQHSTRWDEMRARAYAEYGYAVKNVFYLCGRIVNYLGFGAMPEHFDLEEALNELGRLASERTAKWESVLLLGTAETVSAARKWHRLVGKAQAFVREGRTNVDEWNILYDQINAARECFYEAARRDLDIRSGPLPPWKRWDPLSRIDSGDKSSGEPSDAG